VCVIGATVGSVGVCGFEGGDHDYVDNEDDDYDDATTDAILLFA